MKISVPTKKQTLEKSIEARRSFTARVGEDEFVDSPKDGTA